MRIAFFSTHAFDREFFDAANRVHGHDIQYLEARLTSATSALASGAPAVCAFVNDDLHESVLTALHASGVRLIALRSAGFNHVDLPKALALGLTVARVPAYSPYAVAEHTVAMMLSLNRKIHRAYARVREGNSRWTGCWGSTCTAARWESWAPVRSALSSRASSAASAAAFSRTTSPSMRSAPLGCAVRIARRAVDAVGHRVVTRPAHGRDKTHRRRGSDRADEDQA